MKKLGTAIALVMVLGVIGCGGGGGSSSGFSFSPDSGDAQHWAQVWCQVNGSMTRDDVIQLMGQPTAEYDANQAQPQSQWSVGAWEYTAFYDANGNVTQAYTGVDPADKPFPCKAVRYF